MPLMCVSASPRSCVSVIGGVSVRKRMMRLAVSCGSRLASATICSVSIDSGNDLWEVANIYEGIDGVYSHVKPEDRIRFAALKAVEQAAYRYGKLRPATATLPVATGGEAEVVNLSKMPKTAVHRHSCAAQSSSSRCLPTSQCIWACSLSFWIAWERRLMPARSLSSWWMMEHGSPLQWWSDSAVAASLERLPVDCHAAMLRLRQNAGASAARDAGLRFAHSQGAAIGLLIDIDCLAAPTWAEEHMAAQLVGPGILCGCTRAASKDAVSRFHVCACCISG